MNSVSEDRLAHPRMSMSLVVHLEQVFGCQHGSQVVVHSQLVIRFHVYRVLPRCS